MTILNKDWPVEFPFPTVNRKQIRIWDCIYSLYLKMVKSDIQPTMKIACS